MVMTLACVAASEAGCTVSCAAYRATEVECPPAPAVLTREALQRSLDRRG